MEQANRIVHGLWIGGRLSKLELLTIYSFIDHGHEFHLWTYSDIQTPLPAAVIIRNAADVLPMSAVYRRTAPDLECGVGRGSFSPFSDLFRYKLLYQTGGYWVDMDITCLKPLDFAEPYVFRSHRVGVVGNIVKCPPQSKLMNLTYERALQAGCADWHFGNRALSTTVRELGLAAFIRDDISNGDAWLREIHPLIKLDVPIPKQYYVLHWLNEFWRTICADKGFYRGVRVVNSVPHKDWVDRGSALGKLYAKYGLK